MIGFYYVFNSSSATKSLDSELQDWTLFDTCCHGMYYPTLTNCHGTHRGQRKNHVGGLWFLNENYIMVVITFEVWPSKPAANNNSGLIVILVLLDPLERKLADLQAQSFRQIDPDDYRYRRSSYKYLTVRLNQGHRPGRASASVHQMNAQAWHICRSFTLTRR